MRGSNSEHSDAGDADTEHSDTRSFDAGETGNEATDAADDRPRVGDRLDALEERVSEADELLVCLDFDGTLAPIVERPEDAEILPGNAAVLEELYGRDDVEVAVVSGRSLEDVRARAEVDDLAYAGNHGLELCAESEATVHPAAARHRPTVEAVAEDVAEDVGDIDGVIVERKDVTATVHYRLAADEDVPAVERTVEERVEGKKGIELTDGKQILEIRPAVEWDKGRAVEWLAETLADDPLVVYVGDDTTDEAAFEVLVRGISIVVGDPGDSAADYRVADPEGVGRLLDWLSGAVADEQS